MSGDALGWYQRMHQNDILSTWEEFTNVLELLFGPSAFKNHQQAFFKLKQTSTVTEYQKEFEQLCNRVIGLPPTTILDCFFFDLRDDIQREQAILQPTTIPIHWTC